MISVSAAEHVKRFVLKTLYRYGMGTLSGRRITVRVVLPVFTAAPNRQFNMEEKQKKLGDIQILIYSGKTRKDSESMDCCLSFFTFILQLF